MGEIWWDLSTVRYLWYEQDTQEYRHNTWGKLFPGSSIDIYEWVETNLLPSQWNTRSSTADQQVTGTALYGDDSQYTVVQRYNSRLDRMVNVYYYWVRNKMTLPLERNIGGRHAHAHRKIQHLS